VQSAKLASNTHRKRFVINFSTAGRSVLIGYASLLWRFLNVGLHVFAIFIKINDDYDDDKYLPAAYSYKSVSMNWLIIRHTSQTHIDDGRHEQKALLYCISDVNSKKRQHRDHSILDI